METSQLDNLSGKLRNIKETRNEIYAISFDSVVQYCIDIHDKTLTRLLEMQGFIEAHMGLFWNPDETLVKRDERDCRFGFKNFRNKVVVYKNEIKNVLDVWIDGGLCFWYNLKTKKVVFIGNNLNCSQEQIGWSDERGNLEGQYCEYHFFDCWDNGNYPKEGYERFFIHPTSLPVEPGTERSYEKASELKRKVDEDWEEVNQTYKCLVDCVEQIQKDEAEYLANMNQLLGSVKEGDGVQQG